MPTCGFSESKVSILWAWLCLWEVTWWARTGGLWEVCTRRAPGRAMRCQGLDPPVCSVHRKLILLRGSGLRGNVSSWSATSETVSLGSVNQTPGRSVANLTGATRASEESYFGIQQKSIKHPSVDSLRLPQSPQVPLREVRQNVGSTGAATLIFLNVLLFHTCGRNLTGNQSYWMQEWVPLAFLFPASGLCTAFRSFTIAVK